MSVGINSFGCDASRSRNHPLARTDKPKSERQFVCFQVNGSSFEPVLRFPRVRGRSRSRLSSLQSCRVSPGTLPVWPWTPAALPRRLRHPSEISQANYGCSYDHESPQGPPAPQHCGSRCPPSAPFAQRLNAANPSKARNCKESGGLCSSIGLAPFKAQTAIVPKQRTS